MTDGLDRKAGEETHVKKDFFFFFNFLIFLIFNFILFLNFT